MTGNLCRMPTLKFRPSSKSGFPYKSLWIEKGPGDSAKQFQASEDITLSAKIREVVSRHVKPRVCPLK